MKKITRILLLISINLFILGLMQIFAKSTIIQNDTFWKDTSGNPIYSQGGNVIKVGSIYYWYGIRYKGAVNYYHHQIKNKGTKCEAFTCYSSTDLVHWKYENDIFVPHVKGWVGRCGVAYNRNTKKYVLISQYPGGELFATCSTPNGNFTFNHVQLPPNIVNTHTGDQTVFNDDNGKSYLICSSSRGRSHLYVLPLRESDFLGFDAPTEIYRGHSREGNCMFKYKGRYYFCSSDLHGWNASHCYYISATNILGPYGKEGIMRNTDLDFCHVTQTGFFITVSGTKDTTVLFCGDRWCDFAGNGVGYNQWCPVTFHGTTPVFNSLTRFNLNASAGTWKVAAGNNYVLNPGFEADRLLQTHLAGWHGAMNARGSHDTGRFCLLQDSKGTAFQNISHLPNGKYKLKVWMQSSGGQKTCMVFVSGYGGKEMNVAINKPMSNWTQVTIPDIRISKGKCEIGITSVNKGNNWCKVDDVSLVRVGDN